jgi:hypothetical protein
MYYEQRALRKFNYTGVMLLETSFWILLSQTRTLFVPDARWGRKNGLTSGTDVFFLPRTSQFLPDVRFCPTLSDVRTCIDSGFCFRYVSVHTCSRGEMSSSNRLRWLNWGAL